MNLNRRQALVGAGAVSFTPYAAIASARPQRIISLNPCLDAILVEVADRSQIKALSHYSRIRQQSNIYELSLTFPQTHGTAEEIISLRPDVVLGSRHGERATRNAVDRMGITQSVFGVPASIHESLQQVRDIAKLVGYPERGDDLIARINAAIAAHRPTHSRRLRALIYQPNGFAAGQGTLMSEMMEAAGLTNVAGEYGVGRWGNVSIESILSNPPEVLLSGTPRNQARSWAERIMHHPALASLKGRVVQAPFDERLLYCGGPVLIRTAQALGQARDLALEQLS